MSDPVPVPGDPEQRLTEIEQTAAAATAGPWEWAGPHVFPDGNTQHWGLWAARWNDVALQGKADFERLDSADAAFIAAARSDVPWLASELRKAWAEQDEALLGQADLIQEMVGRHYGTEQLRAALEAVRARLTPHYGSLPIEVAQAIECELAAALAVGDPTTPTEPDGLGCPAPEARHVWFKGSCVWCQRPAARDTGEATTAAPKNSPVGPQEAEQ